MPVIKLVYGLHEPRYLSDAKVIKYYNHLGLQGEIYRLKHYDEENRSRYRYLGNSFPDLLLFNTTGQLTRFELNCSGGLDSIASLAPQDIDTMTLAGKSLRDFMDDSYVINTSKTNDTAHLQSPLYVVKFAEYAGLLNKNHVPDLVERLSSRTDVQYIVLNMDYTVQE